MGMKLENKVAVVTGASSGMGKAIARLFACEGAKVVGAARRKELIDELSAEAAKTGGVIRSYAADMTKPEDVAGMIDYAVKEYGKVDILVNCAGILDNITTVGSMTDELWNEVIRVNLTAPMEASRSAINYMLEQNSGGVVLNIASVGGLRGAAGGAAYVASKHGLVGLTKNIAFMYADSNIRCNVICPGGVDTEMANLNPAELDPLGAGRLGVISATSPRIGKPEEVAAAALFLVSDEASLVNGVVMPVDSGWCAG